MEHEKDESSQISNSSDLLDDDLDRKQNHENYFDIISFSHRIHHKQSKLRKLMNDLIRSYFIVIFYFFGSSASGYLLFLEQSPDLARPISIFQILLGYLIISVMANLWGVRPGLIGGSIGEILYQIASIHTIKPDFLIILLLVVIFSAIIPYNKDKFIPKLHVMRLFYSLAALSILLPIMAYILPHIFYSFNMENPQTLVYLKDMIIFSFSIIINIIFSVPIIIVIIDRVLKKSANEKDIVYKVILTHHYELDSDHALPIKFDGYYVFVCTRCTGMVSGILFNNLMAYFLIFSRGSFISPLTAFTIVAILPILGIIDWGTQKLGFRKSNDYTRVITGFLLGIALDMTRFTYGLDLQISLLIGLYFAIFFLLVFLSRKIQLHKDLRNLN
ncbi:MAG: DUF2085 domain-containing protein [Promethearchaeota archaeon]